MVDPIEARVLDLVSHLPLDETENIEWDLLAEKLGDQGKSVEYDVAARTFYIETDDNDE